VKYNNDNIGRNKVFKGIVKDKPITKIPKVWWKQKKVGLDSDGDKWFQIYECVMSGGPDNHLPPVYQLMIKFGQQTISMYFNDPMEAEQARELLFYGIREYISDTPFKEAKEAHYKELKAWTAKTEAKINKTISKADNTDKPAKIA
jgi:hypothetical protein